MLIEEILKRAKAVKVTDRLKGPREKMEAGYREIGVVPDELKGLAVVMFECEKAVDEFVKDLEARVKKVGSLAELPKEEWNKLKLDDGRLYFEFGLARTCFWNSLRHAIPEIAREEEIIICEDWKVAVRSEFCCPLRLIFQP